MLERLKRLWETTFKRTNFKAFFFFLIFSFFIWVLIQFAKNYQQIVEVNVNFVNVPKDKIVEKKQDDFQIRINDNGFNIAWFTLLKPEIEVDLEELPFDDNSLFYILDEREDELREALDIDFENITFLRDSIAIPYQQKEVKKVAVSPQIEINYAPGYSSEELIQVEPDSIKVSGTKEVLDSLFEVKTNTLRLENVKEDVSGNVGISTSGIGNVTLYKKQVSYQLKVEKFTEGRVEVPIEVINEPEDINITIFPKQIVVIYTISLANYDDVSKTDFRVVCDYEEVGEGQEFFVPKIVKQPETVTTTRLNLNKVQFVIKK